MSVVQCDDNEHTFTYSDGVFFCSRCCKIVPREIKTPNKVGYVKHPDHTDEQDKAVRDEWAWLTKDDWTRKTQKKWSHYMLCGRVHV